MDEIKQFSPLIEALTEMFLPEYTGFQWLVSPSQYMTFTFWIIISIVIEIMSNASAFADEGM